MDHTTEPSARHQLGAVLRRYRSVAGLTQQALARQVGYSRSTIANAEAGDLRAGEFYRRCDATLGADGALTAAYLALEPASAGQSSEVVSPESEPLAGIPPEEAIEYLRMHWHLLVRTDNLLGPVVALPLALARLSALGTLLSGATGPLRSALLGLSARYAGTAAAIYDDTGQVPAAVQWAARALEWGHEVDDRRAVAWALYRRSQLHAAGGDAVRALAVGRAALREGGRLTAPMTAAIHAQQACSHALAGAHDPCERELRRAAALAGDREYAGDAGGGRGSFCTHPWVAAQRGKCELLLGATAAAVGSLQAALAGVAPVYQRDRGLILGWLAEAYALEGADGEAQRHAGQSLAIGAATGSVRVLAQARAALALTKAAA